MTNDGELVFDTWRPASCPSCLRRRQQVPEPVERQPRNVTSQPLSAVPRARLHVMIVWIGTSSERPHRPEAQDVALSRPKHGFESRWGRHPDGRDSLKQSLWLFGGFPPDEFRPLRVVPQR